MNNTQLIGRLTKDVDLKYTPNGVAVANFTLAINRPFKNQNGENEADFINIVVWKKAAENVAQYMRKGSKVAVSGRLQSRTYEDKDGKTIFVTEVVSNSVEFLDTKNGNSNQNQGNQKHQDQQNNSQQSSPFTSNSDSGNGIPDITDDQLPF